jgi:hypothetical protein
MRAVEFKTIRVLSLASLNGLIRVTILITSEVIQITIPSNQTIHLTLKASLLIIKIFQVEEVSLFQVIIGIREL